MPDLFATYLVSVLNGVAIGVLLFMMAVGLSLIFGLMDVLNLAHGAVFLIGSYVAFDVAGSGDGGFLLAVAAALAVGLLVGGGLAVCLRPLRRRGHLDQVLLTLGIAFVLLNTSAMVWGDDFRSVPAPTALQGSGALLGQSYPVYRLAVIVIGFVVAALVYAVFERSRLGAILRAMVDDRDMVDALGVDTRALTGGVLAAGSGLAAVGGVIGAPILSIRPGLEWEVLILALIVVVIGGLGSVKGAFVGALLIGQVQSLGVALLPEFAAFGLFGAMAVVLLVRPDGLFGQVATG